MNSCELAASITALAVTMANQINDNDELELLAAAMTQLADTLNTIAVQRGFEQSKVYSD